MIKSQGAAALTRDRALALDADDPLASFRERFVIDDPDLVYLDGNSLGCLPRVSRERVEDVLSRWGKRIVSGWDDGWLGLPIDVGDRLAAAALGAAAGQVAVGDSTTVCLYKLVSAALDARPGRTEIVTDVDNFPTDRYVLEGLAAARGLTIRWLQFERDGGPTAATVADAITSDTALVTFSHVSYLSAHIAESRAINQIAHDAGALTLWDLCHSVGSVPVTLDADGTDLAVGCTYKYLGGGPGAPAFMYVRAELQAQLSQPIWGWLGRRDPFAMAPGFERAAGMQAFLSGTPPVIALTAVDAGVELVAEAGIDAIRSKGIALTEYAIELADARLQADGVDVLSPRDPDRRGAHVALAHPRAEALTAGLIERRVVPDFRRPDIIRFGLSPLTTRFVDVHDGVEALAQLLATA
jgi:kynureninase